MGSRRRVVSMPCVERFLERDEGYREAVAAGPTRGGRGSRQPAGLGADSGRGGGHDGDDHVRGVRTAQEGLRALRLHARPGGGQGAGGGPAARGGVTAMGIDAIPPRRPADRGAVLGGLRARGAGAARRRTRATVGQGPDLVGAGGHPEVANRVGWLDLPEQAREALPELEGFRDELVREGMTDVVVLGMGGSSLAPEVVRRRSALARAPCAFTCSTRPTREPCRRSRTRSRSRPRSSSSPRSRAGRSRRSPSSGTSTSAWARTRAARSPPSPTPGSSLADLAAEHGFRRTFLANPDVGGRYSALSHFGIVPAALAGAPMAALLDPPRPPRWTAAGARATRALARLPVGRAGPARARQAHLAGQPGVEGFGLWVEQLIAESTGKGGPGVLPVAGEPLGAAGACRPSACSPTCEAGNADAEAVAARRCRSPRDRPARGRAGGPGAGCSSPRSGHGGHGGPGARHKPLRPSQRVQSADATSAVLGTYAERALCPRSRRRATRGCGAGCPSCALAAGAIMGCRPPTASTRRRRRCALVRDSTGAALTFGYRPRFLHSTGQLHKGGPPDGAFLQILGAIRARISVQAGILSFGTLRDAQAIRDLETLRSAGAPRGAGPAARGAGGAALEGSRTGSRGYCDADHAPGEPPGRGARASAAGSHHARDLRVHRRPIQAQAAARDLQPRPRGRPARALQPDRERAHGPGRGRARELAREAITAFSRTPPDPGVLDALLERTTYVRGAGDDPGTYDRLAQTAEELDAEAGVRYNRVFYLATSPEFFEGSWRGSGRRGGAPAGGGRADRG